MIVTTVLATLSILTSLTLAIPTRRAISFVKEISTFTNGGVCIVPAGNLVGNGTPVQLASCSDGGSPWAYDDAAGTFSLTGTNQCLDVTDGIDGDGTKLQTWECTGGPNQQFKPLTGPFIGTNVIQWTGSNKCLDVTNGAFFSPGTPLQVWECASGANYNQVFFLADPTPIKFTTTANTNFCMNVAGGSSADGTSLQIATCASPTPPQQKISPFAAGFRFFNNSVIDLTNGDQTNGNKLQIWTSFGNANQHWFYDAANKAIRLIANPNKCIDITDGVFANGTQLQIWDCTFGPNQQFTSGYGL